MGQPEPVNEPLISDRLLFQRLMETLPAHVYFKDLEGRFICINREHARKFGLATSEEAVGRTDYDFFPEELARVKDADEHRIISTGEGIVDLEEANYTDPMRPQWVLTTKLPLRGKNGDIVGTFGISRNITETKLARDEIAEQHRLLRTLIEILPCRIFVKNQDGRIQVANEAYRRAMGLTEADVIIGRTLSELVPPERGDQATLDDQEVLQEGHSIINREQRDVTAGNLERWVLLSKVPLRDGGGSVRGLVGMAADITAQKDAEALANRTLHNLEERNRQIRADLVVARDMQRELMQASLRSVNDMLDRPAGGFPPLTLYYEPSERLAGDFVHAIAFSPTQVGILICDVMGHGVRAALVTSLIRGLVGDLRMQELAPGEVLSRLNTRLCTLLDQPVMPRFVTAIYAVIDLQAGSLVMANAGHPSPLLAGAGGEVKTVQAGLCDPALGLVIEATYATSHHTIARGDRVLFLTDGWLEEPDAAGEEFGCARLAAQLKSAPADPDQALCALAAALQRHSGLTQCRDDLCAVLLQT